MLKINSIKFLIISFSVVLASNDSVLKPMDIFEMEGVSDPQISPDGSKILYVRSGSDIMKDKRYSNIWIINFDGSDNRPITSGKNGNSQPRWSPDGKQIIYVSSFSKIIQI